MSGLNRLDNKLYLEDIERLTWENLDFRKLKNSSILITWARGLIGSFLIDTIMFLNNNSDLNCHIYALGSSDTGLERFKEYIGNNCFSYIIQDVNEGININGKIDYIIHLASNTHPVLYATHPISTILTNVLGTKNLLDYAVNNKCKRFLFASSVEIYGENKDNTELFDENYCGYINSNTLRAGYPESKRCGEALCQAYKEEKKLDIVIARIARSYGPTIKNDDSRAISQFINKALNNEDIVLKSEWIQVCSYTYVYDVVYGLLTILINGKNGECYNISYPESDITLRDMAELIARYVDKKVVFELPNEIERKGFSKPSNARMGNTKIKKIWFNPRFDMNEGIKRTLKILKEIS